VRWAARGPRSGDLFRVSGRPGARVKASLYRAQRQVVAGLLRDWSCSIVPGGGNCNGRHAELVNKIKDPRFNTPTANQEVGSSNLSGRATIHLINQRLNLGSPTCAVGQHPTCAIVVAPLAHRHLLDHLEGHRTALQRCDGLLGAAVAHARRVAPRHAHRRVT